MTTAFLDQRLNAAPDSSASLDEGDAARHRRAHQHDGARAAMLERTRAASFAQGEIAGRARGTAMAVLDLTEVLGLPPSVDALAGAMQRDPALVRSAVACVRAGLVGGPTATPPAAAPRASTPTPRPAAGPVPTTALPALGGAGIFPVPKELEALWLAWRTMPVAERACWGTSFPAFCGAKSGMGAYRLARAYDLATIAAEAAGLKWDDDPRVDRSRRKVQLHAAANALVGANLTSEALELGLFAALGAQR